MSPEINFDEARRFIALLGKPAGTIRLRAFLHAQQAAVDQLRQRVLRRPGRREALAHAFLRDALAVARIGEQFVLEKGPHARGLVRQHAFVELVEDGVA